MLRLSYLTTKALSTGNIHLISALFKSHSTVTKADVIPEETVHSEMLDDFTKEFLKNRIEITDFQRWILRAGSSIASLINPRR